MSSPTNQGHGHGQGGGGTDVVRYDLVIKVGIGSLVIFAASIWWAAIIWKDAMHASETKAGKAVNIVEHRTEIGMVDQVPFATDQRLHGWRADRKRELETYTWVDKSKGVVRMPIEAAMDKVAGGAMPAGAPK